MSFGLVLPKPSLQEIPDPKIREKSICSPIVRLLSSPLKVVILGI